MATKAKPDRVRERVYLTFPKELINEPVLSLLSKQFDIVFNIRGSTVTSEMALVALEIDGKNGESAKRLPGSEPKALPSNRSRRTLSSD